MLVAMDLALGRLNLGANIRGLEDYLPSGPVPFLQWFRVGALCSWARAHSGNFMLAQALHPRP